MHAIFVLSGKSVRGWVCAEVKGSIGPCREAWKQEERLMLHDVVVVVCVGCIILALVLGVFWGLIRLGE